LQPSRDVDAIPQKVLAMQHDVAQVDPDSECTAILATAMHHELNCAAVFDGEIALGCETRLSGRQFGLLS
jgi:hypothetical protein